MSWNWAQWLIVANQIASTLVMIHYDYQGRPARKPLGFPGVVGTLLVNAGVMWVFYKAGLFAAHL